MPKYVLLKTAKILQFWNKKFSTCVIPAQEVNKMTTTDLIFHDYHSESNILVIYKFLRIINNILENLLLSITLLIIFEDYY